MSASPIAELDEARIRQLLSEFIEPYMGKSLVETSSVKSVQVDPARIRLGLQFAFAADGYLPALSATVENFLADRIAQATGVDRTRLPRIEAEATWRVEAHVAQRGMQPIKGIKNVLAIASGKGGVGKSTVTANLALALAADGARVGVLDADIYGPSQPRMLGARGRPESKDGKTLEPVVSYGIQIMSIGFLVEEETPMIWRGPMVTQALEQMLRDTNWRDIDYLIVDLPPGTGDIQLTLAQRVPVSGALIVTTPQDIALQDARKGLKMFEKVEVPVLGVVENMSVHVCSQCGHSEPVFGSGGGERMARQYGIHLLGALPLDIHIREDADGGEPTAAKSPDSVVGRELREVARRVSARLGLQPRDYSQVFGNIEIGNAG